MTCIVGWVEKGTVWMGADSCGSNSYTKDSVIQPKLFKKDNMLIGYTGSFRMGQLLQWRLSIPKRHDPTSIEEWLATSFADNLRTCFKDGGFAEKDKEQESGGFFLIGFEGRLFTVQSDYSVLESRRGFDAAGSGEVAAQGALFLAKEIKLPPDKAIRLALKAASAIVQGVGEPFHFLKI